MSRDLQIVGNGLGLSWTRPILLNRESTADSWSMDFVFNATSDGYICSYCGTSDMIPVRENFEYRILTSSGLDMIGGNFGFPLLSLSTAEIVNFTAPVKYSYPYFFTQTGSIREASIRSSDSFIQTRIWAYYLPASFDENTYKKYPTSIGLDMSRRYLAILRVYVEEEVEKGHSEEMILIGSGDYHPLPGNPADIDRTDLLTHVSGAGFNCKVGTFEDMCGGCLPPNLPPRENQEAMRDRCGVPIISGGRGESYLDHIINEVAPNIQSLTGNRLFVDRKRFGIGGCSLAGLMACYALWTRPETFGFGACQSSSFFWPMIDHQSLNNGFDFLNNTLKTKTGLRLPQSIYIDVTDGEDNPYYAQFGAALSVFNTIAAVTADSFTKDENLRFVLAQNQNHCDATAFARAWLSVSPFLRPGGGPKNPALYKS